MNDGVIVEQGTHNELIELNGAYSALVTAQALREKEHGINEVEEEPVVTAENPEEFKSMKKDEVALKISTHEFETEKSIIKSGDQIKQTVAKLKAEEEEKKRLEAEKLKQKLPWGRLLYYNRAETGLFILGSLAAAINGLIFPLFSLVSLLF